MMLRLWKKKLSRTFDHILYKYGGPILAPNIRTHDLRERCSASSKWKTGRWKDHVTDIKNVWWQQGLLPSAPWTTHSIYPMEQQPVFALSTCTLCMLEVCDRCLGEILKLFSKKIFIKSRIFLRNSWKI